MNQDYKEAICKASDTIGFLVRELQDVHSNAPNVGTEMIVLDWLGKIVEIKTGINRLAAEARE